MDQTITPQSQVTLDATQLQRLLESLTGQPLPLPDSSSILPQVAESIAGGHSIGYSQFNELLLTVGYDRIDVEFFRYLCNPSAVTSDDQRREQISSTEELRDGINAFRELALLLFGNVKYGFKALSGDPDTLKVFVKEVRSARSEREFRSRHDPLVPLKNIESKDSHLLGYISGNEIEQKLISDPENSTLLALKAHREEIVARGKWNHNAYLTFDHLDVYVATSMREKHEYVFVNEFMSRITTDRHVVDLKLRFFDPTCAYCSDRLDKGLAEALMLKRATCTVYLAQESDTLGKDSELASTLAQGKPVIAFVPEMSDKFWDYLYNTFISIYPDKSEEEILLHLLRIYNPNAAWTDPDVQLHLSKNVRLQNSGLLIKARTAVADHYDKRADVLKNIHPLGLQTNLNTGVANGVLVARSTDICAQLISRIVLNKMQFSVEDKGSYVLLKEKLTGCIFRVMTGDRLLTNSFWNFYNVA